MNEDVFKGKGVEIRLGEEEDFLLIVETLSRIGIASNEKKTLTQSCHLLHKRGRYAIVHFLEMMELDGRKTNFNDEDRARRNLIAHLLQDWELCKIVDEEKYKTPMAHISKVKVLPYSQKKDWTLVPKYQVGRK